MLFDGRARGAADQLQIAVAHGPPGVVAAALPPEEESGFDGPPRLDPLQDIDPVERSPGWRRGAGQADDRPGKIHGDADLLADEAAGDLRGPTHDGRHADAALEGRTLVARQRSVAPALGRAVVAHEDDDGIVGKSQVVQGLQNLPHALIQPLDHGHVGRLRSSALILQDGISRQRLRREVLADPDTARAAPCRRRTGRSGRRRSAA